MKSKKFVLAALVLLAITMVLLPLAGCKNDSVPETPAAKLVSISVTTPPERTVYSERQSFDPTGMVVTATYDDKSQREVTGWETDFNTVVTEKGLAKTVTVSYTEGGITREDTFTVDVASYQFTETVQDVDPSYTGTRTDGTYKKFGDWPQTIKEEDVEIGDGTLVRGGLTYYVGSDGNYYVKITAKPYEDTYTYSDGNLVEKDKEVYFKVEPIVWRVLTEDYKDPEGKSTGNALLLAESILTGGIPYYVSREMRSITKEKETGTETETETETVPVYANNWQYSTVRAWLNGRYESDDPQANEYAGKGFLQTAFTADAQSLIAGTSVDNTAASTTDAGSNLPSATDYVCANTTDNVFLLSEEEATTGVYLKEKDITDEDYGFDEYYASGEGNTRIRVTTDYAKATGAYQEDSFGGWWWLRSPYYNYEYNALVINSYGYADRSLDVNITYGGVVPALSISLK